MQGIHLKDHSGFEAVFLQKDTNSGSMLKLPSDGLLIPSSKTIENTEQRFATPFQILATRGIPKALGDEFLLLVATQNRFEIEGILGSVSPTLPDVRLGRIAKFPELAFVGHLRLAPCEVSNEFLQDLAQDFESVRDFIIYYTLRVEFRGKVLSIVYNETKKPDEHGAKIFFANEVLSLPKQLATYIGTVSGGRLVEELVEGNDLVLAVQSHEELVEYLEGVEYMIPDHNSKLDILEAFELPDKSEIIIFSGVDFKLGTIRQDMHNAVVDAALRKFFE